MTTFSDADWAEATIKARAEQAYRPVCAIHPKRRGDDPKAPCECLVRKHLGRIAKRREWKPGDPY
ncbi:MAG: hypothetical protein WAL84_01925 [Candidatus Dormiibacterota bacterium]